MNIELNLKDHFVEIGDRSNNGNFSIFNSTKFIDLHKKDFNETVIFNLIHKTKNKSEGVVHFSTKNKSDYFSPIRGTFGCFEFEENISLDIKEAFINSVMEWFEKEKPGSRISIKQAPVQYDIQNLSEVSNCLIRRGFRISKVDLSYGILVSEKQFFDQISHGNRKKINQCMRNEIVSQLLNRVEYSEAYKIIAENRKKKGFPITMTFEALDKMAEEFSDKTLVLGVKKSDGEIIASSFCFQVNPRVLYVFYWAEKNGFETFSPVTLIAKSLYEYCQSKKIEFLDIGVSTDNEVPNYGLIRFKKNLGCRGAFRLQLEGFIK